MVMKRTIAFVASKHIDECFYRMAFKMFGIADVIDVNVGVRGVSIGQSPMAARFEQHRKQFGAFTTGGRNDKKKGGRRVSRRRNTARGKRDTDVGSSVASTTADRPRRRRNDTTASTVDQQESVIDDTQASTVDTQVTSLN